MRWTKAGPQPQEKPFLTWTDPKPIPADKQLYVGLGVGMDGPLWMVNQVEQQEVGEIIVE